MFNACRFIVFSLGALEIKGTIILVGATYKLMKKSQHISRERGKTYKMWRREAPEKEKWVHRSKNTQHGPPFSELVNSVQANAINKEQKHKVVSLFTRNTKIVLSNKQTKKLASTPLGT